MWWQVLMCRKSTFSKNALHCFRDYGDAKNLHQQRAKGICAGTGTRDMVTRCRAANLPAPEFTLTDGFKVVIRRDLHGDLHGNAPQVSNEENVPEDRLLFVLKGEMSRQDLQSALSLKNTDYFRLTYITPALEKGYIEMTLPDKPNSRLQKYRLTDKGKKRLKRER
jgi:hypothetical protein